jgi:hypothetical protein
MKSFNLNIRFETRREMSVLPIMEPGNDSVFEVVILRGDLFPTAGGS